MLDFIYETRVEYANICKYVIFTDCLKNIFLNKIVDLFLSESSEFRKCSINLDRIEFKDESERDKNEIDRVRVEHEIEINSRCEIFAKSFAISFC